MLHIIRNSVNEWTIRVLEILLVSLSLVIFGGAVFVYVWISRALYKKYSEQVVFLEVAIAMVGFFSVVLLGSTISERWAGSIGILYLWGLGGYCAWRGKRRKRLNAVRIRQELEREYLALRNAGEYANARSIAMAALGEFLNVGAVEYFAHYAHVRDTIVIGMSADEERDWDRRWRMRLGEVARPNATFPAGCDS